MCDEITNLREILRYKQQKVNDLIAMRSRVSDSIRDTSKEVDSIRCNLILNTVDFSQYTWVVYGFHIYPNVKWIRLFAVDDMYNSAATIDNHYDVRDVSLVRPGTWSAVDDILDNCDITVTYDGLEFSRGWAYFIKIPIDRLEEWVDRLKLRVNLVEVRHNIQEIATTTVHKNTGDSVNLKQLIDIVERLWKYESEISPDKAGGR